MQSSDSDTEAQRGLDYASIKQTVGTIEPWKVSAILALGATVGELEQAVAWMTVESDGSGFRHAADRDVATDSRVAGIYEVLAADRAEDED